VHSKMRGRSVRTSPYEIYLQAQRARQESVEFQPLYRQRCRVERMIAELVFHGMRKTRYLGESRRQLQRLWLAAVVNLKRLFALAQCNAVDLRRLVSDLSRPSGVAPPLSACRAPGGQPSKMQPSRKAQKPGRSTLSDRGPSSSARPHSGTLLRSEGSIILQRRVLQITPRDPANLRSDRQRSGSGMSVRS
jgi:hypothetical protein